MGLYVGDLIHIKDNTKAGSKVPPILSAWATVEKIELFQEYPTEKRTVRVMLNTLRDQRGSLVYAWRYAHEQEFHGVQYVPEERH